MTLWEVKGPADFSIILLPAALETQSAKTPSLPVNDTRKACAPKVIWYWCFRLWTHTDENRDEYHLSSFLQKMLSWHFNCTTGPALYSGQCTVIVNGLASTAISLSLTHFCSDIVQTDDQCIMKYWNNFLTSNNMCLSLFSDSTTYF